MVEDVIKEDLSAEALAKEDIAQEDIDLSVEAFVETDDVNEVETQIYEVGFHILPSVEESDISKEVDMIKTLITDNGGVLISDEPPKLIDLAYTISKDIDANRYRFDTAYFGWIKFEIKTNKVSAIKDGMDTNKSILRYLIIKTIKESTLVSKTAFMKDESQKKTRLKSIKTTKKPNKTEESKQTPAHMSEEELDKTIDDLIVE